MEVIERILDNTRVLVQLYIQKANLAKDNYVDITECC